MGFVGGPFLSLSPLFSYFVGPLLSLFLGLLGWVLVALECAFLEVLLALLLGTLLLGVLRPKERASHISPSCEFWFL